MIRLCLFLGGKFSLRDTHRHSISLSVLFPSSHFLPSHQGDIFVSGHLAAEGKQRPASIEQSSCHINQGILPLNRSVFLPVFLLPNHSSSFTCFFWIMLLQECTSGSMKMLLSSYCNISSVTIKMLRKSSTHELLTGGGGKCKEVFFFHNLNYSFFDIGQIEASSA